MTQVTTNFSLAQRLILCLVRCNEDIPDWAHSRHPDLGLDLSGRHCLSTDPRRLGRRVDRNRSCACLNGRGLFAFATSIAPPLPMKIIVEHLLLAGCHPSLS